MQASPKLPPVEHAPLLGVLTLTLLTATAACHGSAASPAGDGGSGGSHTTTGSTSSGGGDTAGVGGGSGNTAGSGGTTGTGGEATDPDFGPNVLIFDPSMSMSTIQAQIDQVFQGQESNQFGDQRYAYLFKPGQYDLDVQIGFYMTVLGLGQSPDDVTITGAVRSKADWFGGNATQNFWRAAENLAVVPTQDSNTEVWAVSQATALRRFHVMGSVNLWDGGWSSGGFIADSRIDATIDSGSQQQFLTRNTALGTWQGGSWNMVFVGDEDAPGGDWPGSPYTVCRHHAGDPGEAVPGDRHRRWVLGRGPSPAVQRQGRLVGAGASAGSTVSLNAFYLAHADSDTADSINAALAAGKHLILTPGVYHLDKSLEVQKPGTIVMGLGLATLLPDQGTPALIVADVSGVSISGILFDAGVQSSDTLLRVGPSPSTQSHAPNPTALFDLSCRVGGASAGSTASCFTIDSSDVLVDNVWLWRADHGDGVGWDVNESQNGIVVNGADVTAYGLFVEHFQAYQTLWNGDGGRVYFYQSEIPYDVPSQGQWMAGSTNGYASYKVAASVQSHDALGLGVYSVFDNPVTLENAVETPSAASVSLQHLITVFLGSTQGAAIDHILNGTGDEVDTGNMQARSAN